MILKRVVPKKGKNTEKTTKSSTPKINSSNQVHATKQNTENYWKNNLKVASLLEEKCDRTYYNIIAGNVLDNE